MKHHKHSHQLSSNGKQNPEPKKIEDRAYELYLDRGSDPGHDFDYWLQAKRELKAEGEAAPGKLVL
jgi:hypothetical protein